MKLLAIDAGNSRIKWGYSVDGAWRERGAVVTVEPEALAAATASVDVPERILATNVAGPDVAARIAGALDRFGRAIEWIESAAEQCGVRSSYARPRQLGADRWAALIGARHLHDGACVVVNAGTTMTVDALSSEGIFLGGFIVPGYEAMRRAMSNETALLKVQEGAFKFFPDNTGDAMATGAANALAGAIERMTRFMTETGEGDAAVLLSGGDAQMLAPLVSAPVQLVDNLVLEGLVAIGTSDV